jgi:hypothetical protein
MWYPAAEHKIDQRGRQAGDLSPALMQKPQIVASCIPSGQAVSCRVCVTAAGARFKNEATLRAYSCLSPRKVTRGNVKKMVKQLYGAALRSWLNGPAGTRWSRNRTPVDRNYQRGQRYGLGVFADIKDDHPPDRCGDNCPRLGTAYTNEFMRWRGGKPPERNHP